MILAMAAKKFQIQVLNQISQIGLRRFPQEVCHVSKDVVKPDAILGRSQDMHGVTIAESVRAIGRAGTGTNNIPVKALSQRGIPVFNPPGANANANVPNMLGQISGAMAKGGLNIHNMINRSKGDMAYTLVDVDSAVSSVLIDELSGIQGVLAVRYLPRAH